MKKEKALVIFLLFLLAFSSLYIGLKKHSGNREYRFLSSLQNLPVTTGEIELPLPVPPLSALRGSSSAGSGKGRQAFLLFIP